MAGWFILLFVVILGVALFLNFLVSHQLSVSEYIDNGVNVEGDVDIVDTTTYRDLSYFWRYKGVPYRVDIGLLRESYELFKGLNRSNSRDYGYYSNSKWYIDGNNAEIDAVGNYLSDMAIVNEFSRIEFAEFIISFVQSLRGRDDFDDYPKFPYETLFEAEGDCEDMAILGSYLLNLAGYSNVLIEFDSHVGLGVDVLCEGISYPSDGKRYCYIETTGAGYLFGNVPSEYLGQDTKIYTSDSPGSLDIDWKVMKRSVNESVSDYLLLVDLINPTRVNISVGYSGKIEYLGYAEVAQEYVDFLNISSDSVYSFNYSFLHNEGNKHRFTFNVIGENMNPIDLKTEWLE